MSYTETWSAGETTPELLSDDFDDEDISDWSGVDPGLTAENGYVECAVDGVNTAPKMEKQLASDQDEVWARFTLRVTSHSSSDGNFCQGMGLWGLGFEKLPLIGFSNDAGTLRWLFTYNQDSGQDTLEVGTVQLDTTYVVKMRFLRSSGPGNDDGRVQAWVDDVLLLDATGLDNDTRQVRYMLVGNNFRSGGMDITFRIDDVWVGNALLDEDAAAPGGAPSWWGSKALRVQVSAGETAFVQHNSLANLTRTRTTFGLYVNSEGLANGDAVYVARLRDNGGSHIAEFYVGQNFGTGQLELTANIHEYDGASAYIEDIAVETFYLIEFEWDLDAETWSYSLDEVEVDSGSITEGALNRELAQLILGVSTAADEAIDYSIGRFTVSSQRADYL